jgi:hypothetical protein
MARSMLPSGQAIGHGDRAKRVFLETSGHCAKPRGPN